MIIFRLLSADFTRATAALWREKSLPRFGVVVVARGDFSFWSRGEGLCALRIDARDNRREREKEGGGGVCFRAVSFFPPRGGGESSRDRAREAGLVRPQNA